jgi:hypothetical protein
LIEEAGTAMPDAAQYEFPGYTIKLTNAEEHYYETMRKINEGEFIDSEVN